MCSLLVQRCMTDGALLDAVCRAAQQAAASVTGCTVWMSFYSVLVSELLTKLPKVDSPLLHSEGLHSAPIQCRIALGCLCCPGRLLSVAAVLCHVWVQESPMST